MASLDPNRPHPAIANAITMVSAAVIFLTLLTSLRRKRVLASESSRARGEFAALAITCHEFFSRSPSGCHGAVQR